MDGALEREEIEEGDKVRGIGHEIFAEVGEDSEDFENQLFLENDLLYLVESDGVDLKASEEPEIVDDCPGQIVHQIEVVENLAGVEVEVLLLNELVVLFEEILFLNQRVLRVSEGHRKVQDEVESLEQVDAKESV